MKPIKRCQPSGLYAMLSRLILSFFVVTTGMFAMTAPSDASDVPLMPRAALLGGEGTGSGMYPAISPEGRLLAYLAGSNGALNIWIAPAGNPSAGRPITQIPGRGVLPIPPRWASDARHVLFMLDNDGGGTFREYSVDIETGRRVLLSPNNDKVQSSIEVEGLTMPKRRGIVMMATNERRADRSDLYEVNVSTGERKLVVKNDEDFYFILNSQLRPGAAIRHSDNGGEELYVPASDGWKLLTSWGAKYHTGTVENLILGIAAEDKTLFLISSLGRDKPALVGINLETGHQDVLAEERGASVTAEVWFHPETGQLQAYATQYLKLRHVAVQESVRRDIDFLNSAFGSQYHIASRAANDSSWIIELNDPVKGIASYLYARNTRKLTRLFEIWPQLTKYPMQPMHAIEIIARDGLTLPSYLTLPPRIGSEEYRKTGHGCSPGSQRARRTH